MSQPELLFHEIPHPREAFFILVLKKGGPVKKIILSCCKAPIIFRLLAGIRLHTTQINRFDSSYTNVFRQRENINSVSERFFLLIGGVKSAFGKLKRY